MYVGRVTEEMAEAAEGLGVPIGRMMPNRQKTARELKKRWQKLKKRFLCYRVQKANLFRRRVVTMQGKMPKITPEIMPEAVEKVMETKTNTYIKIKTGIMSRLF